MLAFAKETLNSKLPFLCSFLNKKVSGKWVIIPLIKQKIKHNMIMKDYLAQTYVKNIILKKLKNYNRERFNRIWKKSNKSLSYTSFDRFAFILVRQYVFIR